MRTPRYGTATAAAKVMADLGITSVSQLNALRARLALEYDPATGQTRPLPSREEMERIYAQEVGPMPGGERRDPAAEHYHATRYLVCPALAGVKLPHSVWRYNLGLLEEIVRRGPPGAGFPSP